MILYDACNKYEQITHPYLIVLTLIVLVGGFRFQNAPLPMVYDEYLKNGLTDLHQAL